MGSGRWCRARAPTHPAMGSPDRSGRLHTPCRAAGAASRGGCSRDSVFVADSVLGTARLDRHACSWRRAPPVWAFAAPAEFVLRHRGVRRWRHLRSGRVWSGRAGVSGNRCRSRYASASRARLAPTQLGARAVAPATPPGEVSGVLARDGGRASETLSAIVKAGVDLGAVSADLQAEGAKSFDESWSDLLKAIETKSRALA